MLKSWGFLALCVATLNLSLATAQQGEVATGLPKPAQSAQIERQTVLVLTTYQYGLPIPDSIHRGILAAFRESNASIGDVFIEHLDLARTDNAEYRNDLASALRHKLAQKRIGIVILEGTPAIEFLTREGKDLFPGVTLLTLITPSTGLLADKQRKVIDIPWRVDPAGTMRVALDLFPKTRRVVVVTGARDGVLPFLDEAKKALAPWKNQLDIEFTNEMTYDQMLQRISTLPADSFVIYSPYFNDTSGRSFVPAEVVVNVVQKSTAPVFGTLEAYLGRGIVGGALLRTEDIGKQAGKLALDYLNGRLELVKPVTTIVTPTQTMLDWRELDHWDANLSRVPENSVVINRPLTLWGQYKLFVIGLGLFILMQSLLILALFASRRRRWTAEQSLKASEENLAITLHSIGDAVITTDQTGRITRMNPTAQRLSGWTLDAAASRLLPEVFRIIDADTREPMADRMQLVMAQGEAVALNNHTVLLAKDGREYQIADSAAPIRNAAGAILGVVLVFSDVTEKYQVQLALRKSEERYRELFENAPDGILIADAESYYLDANPCVCQMLGYAREELIGLHALDIVVESEIPYIQSALSQIKTEPNYKREWQFRRKDGSVIAAEVTVTTMPDGNLLAMIRDVTARKLAEAALKESKERFLALSTMSSDWFWRQDQQFRFTDFSGAFASDFTPPADTVGKTRWELNIDLTPEQWTAHRAILDANLPFRNFEYPIADTKGEVRWYSINGEPLFDEAGTFTGYLGTGNNITTRKRAEEKINELAFFDHLTGLPNRTLLMDRLKQTMAASSRSGGHGALLIIDLDNFKTLNDTRGHDMGDMLLKHIAQRLTACVREGDTVARLGGDEFVVVLAGLSMDEGVAAAAIETVTEKILATLSQPYQLGNVSHHSTASIGVTLFSGDLVTVDDLMKQADLAMYKSKAAGRNVARFFDPTLESAVNERAAMEHDLRRAIVERQFLLHYQPQVLSGQLTGAEVLVRWQHPQRGLVSPAEFIPLAEETGVILPLGCWVLETACIQLAEWAARPGMAHLTVAVNVSAHQFRHDDFVDQVLTVLKNTGANPQRLKLELTESMLVSNVEEIIEKMLALKAQGVGFSLDDFGTGFSSLSYLKRLPLDQLKIDQSFVRDVLNDPNDASIAKTIIALAQNLGLGVIAEGVETEAQREFLASAGCHAYQGYLFSRPLPLNEFENFVRRV